MSFLPTEPPEPPNLSVYGDPSYWTERYIWSYDSNNEKDNTKPRHGISHKIKWDGNGESFQAYEMAIHSHCRQNGLGHLLIPHFMTLYLRYGIRGFEKAPRYNKPGLSVNQFLRDNEIVYRILESVFNVSNGIQVFRHPIQTDGNYDGIMMYVMVVNELGPNQRTQVWIHQRSIQEKYHPRSTGGIRMFVHRYMTAYGELEYFGVRTTERECADNLLKNFCVNQPLV
jgi:hypothetical protein